jgi:hypothetical protein
VLSPDYFVAATKANWTHSVNPFGVSLYTSRLESREQHGSESLERTTAAQWKQLALRYPAINEDRIYLDWQTMVQDWDAVHISISAVAAIQGVRLQTPSGVAGPFILGCRNDILATLELHLNDACGDGAIRMSNGPARGRQYYVGHDGSQPAAG